MPEVSMASKLAVPRSQPERECIGRDEMNLAEFPIALLGHRAATQVLSLHKERELTLPDGRKLQQEWIVTGAPEYGLPQPCDEDILLGLLKIAADQGFGSSKVHFTQRALLALIHWSSQAWSHERLEQGLARLKTTSILAKNSFWQRAQRQYQTLHFGIIDSYKLVDRLSWQKSSALNWARFSNEFFDSVQGGYIKPLALDLYFALDSSVSKRLFRYLDKKRYQKERFEINLTQLASVHVGLSQAKCRYPSWIKQKLEAAHRELQERGFLKAVTYEHNREGDWKVCYTFGASRHGSDQPLLPGIVEAGALLLQELVRRGVTEKVARELLAAQPAAFVEQQLDRFDALHRREPKNIHHPAAFLVHAIRDEWNLELLPGDGAPDPRERVGAPEAGPVGREAEARRLQERATVEALKATLPEDVLQGLRDEAFAKVKLQVGPCMRVHEKHPFVEGTLYVMLVDRYLGGATPDAASGR